jgi:hypothetical protein
MYGPHVGDLQPRYSEPDLLRSETLSEDLADGLGDGHEVRGHQGLKVEPIFYRCFRHDERVPRAQGRGVQEGRAEIVAPDEAGRHLALDDAREDRGQA